MAVGRASPVQHQQQRGHELHQSHHSQMQRIAGDFVHLPAHRHGDDLPREIREQPAAEEQPEVAVAKQLLVGVGQASGRVARGRLVRLPHRGPGEGA
jgi:hypothetical protein